MKLKLSIITCLLIVSACNTLKTKPHNTVDPHVNNIVWSVISFKGRVLNADNYPNGLPFIVFNMQDGKINGNDGCNNFVGIASYPGNNINTGPIASTKMACGNNIIQSSFYDVLATKGLVWKLNNDNILRLYINDAEVIALKERQ